MQTIAYSIHYAPTAGLFMLFCSVYGVVRIVIVIVNGNLYGAVIVAVHCHCESSPGSSDECSTQRQVAADRWTKPISLSQ